MDKLFVDTNIVIDLLGNRMPYADSAEDLFLLAEKKEVELYVSPLSFDNIYYILSKQLSHHQLMKMFSHLLKYIKVLDAGKGVVQNAVSSTFNDFEDALQYYCAIDQKNIKAVITRDRKGFAKGKLAVMTAEEYLKRLN